MAEPKGEPFEAAQYCIHTLAPEKGNPETSRKTYTEHFLSIIPSVPENTTEEFKSVLKDGMT